MNALELRHITKRFAGETVLDDVSLALETGQTLVLFGPSGAGKTVLLRLIAGVVTAEQGTVLIDGKDMTSVAPEARGVGMAFQNFALFPHLSAFANIASPLTAKRFTNEQIKTGVGKVAKLLKIDHVLNHAPRELSNGQKQRTALARALAASPKLLLLDDPLRNVDAKLRFEMRLELPRLLSDQGTSVVYVTQDYKEAMALGDRIAVLEEGEIVQLGTPEDIYLHPATLNIAQLFGDPTINQLEVLPEQDNKGVFVQLSGRRLSLNPGLSHAVGQKCVLGLRPEALGFFANNDVLENHDGAIAVTIETETPLNEKIVTLAVTANGNELLISRPAGTPGASTNSTYINISTPDSALLFDRASGVRITTPTACSNANQAA